MPSRFAGRSKSGEEIRYNEFRAAKRDISGN
jgi:hypothetical protein